MVPGTRRHTPHSAGHISALVRIKAHVSDKQGWELYLNAIVESDSL